MAIRNQLTVAQVRKSLKPGRYLDGQGLYLLVKPPQRKGWILRYQSAGRRREMGLGSFPSVSLSGARELRDAALELLRRGKDPIDARAEARELLAEQHALVRDAEAIPTFKECAAIYIASKQPEWRNAKHAAQWTSTLTTYAFPVIGHLLPADIKLSHIERILKPIWLEKTETASRVMNRIAKVLGYCHVKGYRPEYNPASWVNNLEHVFARPSVIKKVKRQPRLEPEFVPALVKDLFKQTSSPANVLLMIIFSAQRQAEVRRARRSELDFDAGVWSIPVERVKRPQKDKGIDLSHLVPIGPLEQCLMARFSGSAADYLFPGLKEQTEVSETAIRKLIKTYAPKFGHFTMHGFRSTFKDWVLERPLPDNLAGEQARAFLSDRDKLTEAQLGHLLGDDSKLAYLRSTLLEHRREVMRDWHRYCLSKVSAAALGSAGLAEYVQQPSSLQDQGEKAQSSP